MTKENVVRIFFVKMEISFRKKVIQKFWSAKNFSVPPNSAPGLRHWNLVAPHDAYVLRQLPHLTSRSYATVFSPRSEEHSGNSLRRDAFGAKPRRRKTSIDIVVMQRRH